jgi:hypothetical protein
MDNIFALSERLDMKEFSPEAPSFWELSRSLIRHSMHCARGFEVLCTFARKSLITVVILRFVGFILGSIVSKQSKFASPSIHSVDFSSARFVSGIHFSHISFVLLKTRIFRSQNLRTSTANYTTSNTPTYDISTQSPTQSSAGQHISTSSDHRNTAINSNTRRMHQTISNSIHHHISMHLQRPFFEDCRGVYWIASPRRGLDSERILGSSCVVSTHFLCKLWWISVHCLVANFLGDFWVVRCHIALQNK